MRSPGSARAFPSPARSAPAPAVPPRPPDRPGAPPPRRAGSAAVRLISGGRSGASDASSTASAPASSPSRASSVARLVPNRAFATGISSASSVSAAPASPVPGRSSARSRSARDCPTTSSIAGIAAPGRCSPRPSPRIRSAGSAARLVADHRRERVLQPVMDRGGLFGKIRLRLAQHRQRHAPRAGLAAQFRHPLAQRQFARIAAPGIQQLVQRIRRLGLVQAPRSPAAVPPPGSPPAPGRTGHAHRRGRRTAPAPCRCRPRPGAAAPAHRPVSDHPAAGPADAPRARSPRPGSSSRPSAAECGRGSAAGY